MLRKLKIIFIATFLCSPLFSEPDNGKFLPDPEPLLPNHVFFELGGGLNFPLEFFNQGTIPMTSYGGHFFASVDYNWSGWLFGLEYTHDMWGQGKGEYSLMKNFKTNILEFTVRKIISKKAVSWFPKWLEVIPGLGIGVNFITTDYYPSVRAKEDGRFNSVKLGQPGANCLFYNAGLEFALCTGSDMFIPFVGADYNMFYDTSIGGGFAGYPRIYAGLRIYPFGLVNNIIEAREEITEEGSVEGKAFISASPSQDFTPDEDGINDIVTLIPSVENIGKKVDKWKITILDQKGNEFISWEGEGKLPKKVEWDGKSKNGELVFSRNTYTVQLSVIPSEKDRKRTASDELRAETSVTTGILFEVLIPGKKWKVIVNTIHFDPDKETFDKIPDYQKKENYETIESLARQIREHGDVNVVVEGYANNVSNTERENTKELIPLSRLRAEAIMKLLIENGLDGKRLSFEGMGGSNPIALWEDHDNWWKNRRVEFIVTKIE